MFLALNRTVDAASEPVTTAEAKTHLRVTHTDDDTYIDAIVKASRIAAENFCDRAFINQTWVATFKSTDNGRVRLPKPPLVSVTSAEYRDTTDGTLQVAATSTYEVNTDAMPGLIKFDTIPDYDGTYENPIRITYVAGYGAASTDVPPPIIHAVKLLVGHFYQHRSEVVNILELKPDQLPNGVKYLLTPYRFFYS
jgi:uncharacterized phiE125 gp8 family phage protein